ncbi:DNA-binding protein [Rugamonas apoptosis]|uniref:DNA-binding protein n=1 Tax=Rugamonas apoptosis TaxID=2758570 RepID=A0A7W2F6C1_9BURK|nr:DNA-binding protein [Rugamonas apoptosis]MBA5685932.1 DNA-binding protein [Rugamonas apoptosis]
MPRQEVTLDEVTAAASGLQDEGKEVSLDTVREALGAGSASAIHRHLAEWRASHIEPPAPPKPEMPAALVAALGNWAQQFAEEAGIGGREALAQAERDMDDLLKAGEELEAARDELQAQLASVTIARDQALALAAERGEDIDRLRAELRDARQVATDALVGKAKDQLAIGGKDDQLADLRQQIERNVAASAAQSDARLKAEMELIGAVTARDNFEADAKELRTKLDASNAERIALRAELEALKASA